MISSDVSDIPSYLYLYYLIIFILNHLFLITHTHTQLVEDFQADVTINQPSSGAIDDVTAFWDSFSVSSTIADPWGLQREPLSIRSWDDGHRINLHPLSNEMQLPRSWQSDLIVFFRWDSRGGWGLGSSSWSSDVSELDEFMVRVSWYLVMLLGSFRFHDGDNCDVMTTRWMF